MFVSLCRAGLTAVEAAPRTFYNRMSATRGTGCARLALSRPTKCQSTLVLQPAGTHDPSYECRRTNTHILRPHIYILGCLVVKPTAAQQWSVSVLSAVSFLLLCSATLPAGETKMGSGSGINARAAGRESCAAGARSKPKMRSILCFQCTIHTTPAAKFKYCPYRSSINYNFHLFQ